LAGHEGLEKVSGKAEADPILVVRQQPGQRNINGPAAFWRAFEPLKAIQKALVPLDEGVV